MEFETILYEKRNRTAYITLNRPARLNAMSPAMSRDLDDAFEDVDLDDDVWVSVLSGNGRCFCAGADVSIFDSALKTDPRKRRLAEMFRSRKGGGFLECRNFKPLIAAVHGYCYGIMLGVVVQHDILVVTEDAKFGIAEVQRGIGGGGLGVEMTYLGCGRVGTELAITGRDLGGAEAFRLGFANRLVDTRDELLPAAEQIVAQILTLPPLGVCANVRTCRQARQMAMAPLRSLSAGQNLTGSEDFEEATRAFLEKRQPVFKGR